MRPWLPQLALGLALLAGACTGNAAGGSDGSPDGDGPDGEPALLALAELDQALVQANCEYFLRCGFYTDRALCQRALTFNLAASLNAHVAAGTVVYDAAAAFTCVEGIRAGGCYFYDPAPPAPTICRQVFQGTADDEAACAVDAQCRSRACDPSAACGPDQCCAGTCRTPAPVPVVVAEGEVCTSESESLACPDGMVCKLATEATIKFTCVRRAAVGEVCDDVACERELFCMPSATGPSTCVRYGYRGEACSETLAICASRTDYCDKTTFTCVPLGVVGAACESDSTCARSTFCDVEATHTCQPRRGPGSACRLVHDCLAYLDCTDGVCTKLPPRPICPVL